MKNEQGVCYAEPRRGQENNKYIAECRHCGQTLLRFPDAHGRSGGQMQHPLIERNHHGFLDVFGWYETCHSEHVRAHGG